MGERVVVVAARPSVGFHDISQAKPVQYNKKTYQAAAATEAAAAAEQPAEGAAAATLHEASTIKVGIGQWRISQSTG
jgi:hypothetical protein